MPDPIHIHPREFYYCTFPEIELEKLEFALDRLILTGDFLWYGYNLNEPLIQGKGCLTFINNQFGGLSQREKELGLDKPRAVIYHDNYQLPELDINEIKYSTLDSVKELEEAGRLMFSPYGGATGCCHRYTDSSLNYAIRYFRGKPYRDRGPFPFSGGIYLDNRWYYLDSYTFGYLADIKKIHGFFSADIDDSSPMFSLMMETERNELVFATMQSKELKISFMPLTRSAG